MSKSPEQEHPRKAIGWAARDSSGVLSPFKFSRRYFPFALHLCMSIHSGESSPKSFRSEHHLIYPVSRILHFKQIKYRSLLQFSLRFSFLFFFLSDFHHDYHYSIDAIFLHKINKYTCSFLFFF
uniref:Uncharacterized protein n=1 Tax=Nelumbo nucifera TaxID=4432 RepID=A0A822XSW1_NELNU|nr:TPA_asm: hypothetical protein HUJ06_023642 [Nelumbo nucifera]